MTRPIAVHVEPPCAGLKTCSKCRTAKHVLCFCGDSYAHDGLSSECRECASASEGRLRRAREHKLASARRRLGLASVSGNDALDILLP